MNVSSIGKHERHAFMFDSGALLVNPENTSSKQRIDASETNFTPHFKLFGDRKIDVKDLKNFHRESIGNQSSGKSSNPIFQNHEISKNYDKSRFLSNQVDMILESEQELDAFENPNWNYKKQKKSQSFNNLGDSGTKNLETLRKQGGGWEGVLAESQETDVFISGVMKQQNSGYSTIQGNISKNLNKNVGGKAAQNEMNVDNKLTFRRKITLGEQLGNVFWKTRYYILNCL